MAAGGTSRPPMAWSITRCRTFSTSSSPAVCRLAPPPRPSPTTWPSRIGQQRTVLVPPASMPSTCIQLAYPLCDASVARAQIGVVHMFSGSPCLALHRLSLIALRRLVCRATRASGAAAPEQTPRAVGDAHDADVARSDSRRWCRAAQAGGFNTLLVQVRGRGDAYYTGTHRTARRRARRQARRSIRSPPCSTQAHAAGLRVHAWVNVNLVSSAVTLPASREHVDLRAARMADGAARARGGDAEDRLRAARRTSAAWRAGRARTPTTSKGSTPRRCIPRRRITPRP